MVPRPSLLALARSCGILDGYQANDGVRRSVSDRTREELLGAMGFDASSESAAAESICEQRESARARVLSTTDVVPVGRATKLRVPVKAAWQGRVAHWALTMKDEDGGSTRVEGGTRVGRGDRITIPRPALALGVHRVLLEIDCGGATQSASQWAFAAPPACVDVEEELGQPLGYGFWAHIYALSRSGDFGIGDLGHLGRLVGLAEEEGAAFVALQPLHALGNTRHEASPYSPVSRLFRNAIYLDLEAIPEFHEGEAGADALREIESVGDLDRLRSASSVDYESVMALKRVVLERLFRDFNRLHAAGTTARGRAYKAFIAREGDALKRYATYCVLADQIGDRRAPRHDWRRWPARFHDPEGAAVREFARERSPDIEFHCWLQFEMDRQLAALASSARGSLPIGLMGDLAIGSGRASADKWMHHGLFVDGASLGAPPDSFADGQDWDLPPLHPARSRESGHAYWRGVLRCATRGMGALRIDHVMGLFRQFWIPAGRPAAEGAYVEAPSRELLALLAIESQRARCVMVGEDLGTRPAALSPRLARAGILSTRVLPFEQTRTGFRSAKAYGARCYVTAHTHDLPPLRGWCEGRDLELRSIAGDFEEPGALEAARDVRCKEVERLCSRLIRDGWLDRGFEGASADAGDQALAVAVTGFLGSTRAPLLAVSVDDLVGARDPLNLPGLTAQHYPNWAHRMQLSVDELRAPALARSILAAIPDLRRFAGRSQAADLSIRSRRIEEAKATRGSRTRFTTSGQA